jgi:hypothetical protein
MAWARPPHVDLIMLIVVFYRGERLTAVGRFTANGAVLWLLPIEACNPCRRRSSSSIMDLVARRVGDVAHGELVLSRASVVQHKTGAPVRFEMTEQTREVVGTWISEAGLSPAGYLFPNRRSSSPHLSTGQYPRVVKRWIEMMGFAFD